MKLKTLFLGVNFFLSVQAVNIYASAEKKGKAEPVKAQKGTSWRDLIKGLKEGDVEVVAAVIPQYFKPWQGPSTGKTFLEIAQTHNQQRVVDYLKKISWIALLDALKTNNFEKIKLIAKTIDADDVAPIDDLFDKNHQGKTALELAQLLRSNKEIVEYLRNKE